MRYIHVSAKLFNFRNPVTGEISVQVMKGETANFGRNAEKSKARKHTAECRSRAVTNALAGGERAPKRKYRFVTAMIANRRLRQRGVGAFSGV